VVDRAQVIERPGNETERWLIETVQRLSQKAGIGMPEVAIFPSPEPNAFATGANRNKALVAVSVGLLQNMRPDEVEAVLGHEIGHVANGDMITLSLIQGVVNTFVLFLARLLGFIVDRVVLKNERGLGIGYWVTTIAAEIVLGILASAIVMWFSRYREFRADAAGADLAGRQKMIAALERLKRAQDMPSTMPDTLVAFGINPGMRQGCAPCSRRTRRWTCASPGYVKALRRPGMLKRGAWPDGRAGGRGARVPRARRQPAGRSPPAPLSGLAAARLLGQPRGGRRYPVLFDLTGYTGSGWSHTNWKNFDENVPERLARLLHQRRMAPCIVVFPDCFTALGGNQYINSSAIGALRGLSHPRADPVHRHEFRTLATREHRGCFGKSSGGYGALIHGMRYARYWGAVASHSGDAHFELIYRAEWPATLTELGRYRHPPRACRRLARRRHATALLEQGMDDGRIRRFLDSVWQREGLSGTEITTLMMVCMAATYDPDPQAPNGFRVPFHLETGELLPARWRAWLRHDPVRLVRRHAANLKSLRGLYIDCGWRDQYHIHFGSRILSQTLDAAGIRHTYEEFDGTHSGVDHRMDVSLPFLSRALR
jgi:hypothetical protein